MNRWMRIASWLSFTGAMYLIFVEAIWPWFHLPDLGNVGFTLVLVTFALIHCIAIEGGRRAALFFAISAVVSYFMEEVGVRTGLVFGAYHYGDLLGPKLGHVPVIVPLAWFMMIYPSWMVARAVLRGTDAYSLSGITAQAVVAAAVMTAWDVVMDPGMAASGNWIWERGGAYFGVPVHNYAGWLLTTFLVYWITAWVWRRSPQPHASARTFEALPIILYAFFSVRYLTSNHIPALQVVAFFSMGLPSLVALIRVYLHTDKMETVSGSSQSIHRSCYP